MTKLQRKIVRLMKIAGVELEACQCSMSWLETKKQQKEMLNYLIKNPTASSLEVIVKTKEIIET